MANLDGGGLATSHGATPEALTNLPFSGSSGSKLGEMQSDAAGAQIVQTTPMPGEIEGRNDGNGRGVGRSASASGHRKHLAPHPTASPFGSSKHHGRSLSLSSISSQTLSRQLALSIMQCKVHHAPTRRHFHHHHESSFLISSVLHRPPPSARTESRASCCPRPSSSPGSSAARPPTWRPRSDRAAYCAARSTP
jgi:hypothetical protein